MYNMEKKLLQGLPVASFLFKNDSGLVVMLEPNSTFRVWRTSKGKREQLTNNKTKCANFIVRVIFGPQATQHSVFVLPCVQLIYMRCTIWSVDHITTKQKPTRWEGLRQISTCRQVLLKANFQGKPTFMVWCLNRYLVHDLEDIVRFVHSLKVQ